MKKVLALFACVITILAMSGCATPFPMGLAYTDVKMPVNATSVNAEVTKSGSSTAESYVALIAVGDAGINSAVQDGKVSQIKYIDWKAKNILGAYGQYNTQVYGN